MYVCVWAWSATNRAVVCATHVEGIRSSLDLAEQPADGVVLFVCWPSPSNQLSLVASVFWVSRQSVLR